PVRRRSIWLLALLAGCTNPANSEQSVVAQKRADSAHASEQPVVTGEHGPVETIVVQFVDATSGLAVSCDGCPGLRSKQRFEADEFPPITAPLGTRVTLELVALGHVAQTREIVLGSKTVRVPASLERL